MKVWHNNAHSKQKFQRSLVNFCEISTNVLRILTIHDHRRTIKSPNDFSNCSEVFPLNNCHARKYFFPKGPENNVKINVTLSIKNISFLKLKPLGMLFDSFLPFSQFSWPCFQTLKFLLASYPMFLIF